MTAPVIVQMMCRIPRDLHDELKAWAAANDRNVAQTIRAAIREYLEPHR